MGVAVVLLANVFFGGGKCPNLGVVNVRLANNLTPDKSESGSDIDFLNPHHTALIGAEFQFLPGVTLDTPVS